MPPIKGEPDLVLHVHISEFHQWWPLEFMRSCCWECRYYVPSEN